MPVAPPGGTTRTVGVCSLPRLDRVGEERLRDDLRERRERGEGELVEERDRRVRWVESGGAYVDTGGAYVDTGGAYVDTGGAYEGLGGGRWVGAAM